MWAGRRYTRARPQNRLWSRCFPWPADALPLKFERTCCAGTGRIAVICPDNLIAPVRDAVRRKLAVILDPAEYARLIEQPEWDEQISVCGTETVKGLEFDAVVVVEPGLIEDDAPSRLVAASDLYVAMTRPTQKLVIVRTKADEKSLNI